jgi:hypothetical protein
MANSLLPSLESADGHHQVDWDCIVRGQLDADLTKELLREFQKFRPKANEEDGKTQERADARVVIAPLVFLAQHRDGSARRAQRQPYTPILIPATLLSDGRLFANADAFPWIIREALEPSGASEPPIGTMQDFDRFRSTHPNPTGEWPSVLQYAEQLIASVAKTQSHQVTIEAYDRGPTLIQAGYPPSSPATRLRELTNYFCEHVEHLPGCINAVTTNIAAKPLLAEHERRGVSRRHVGQMGGAYPLADLQREALHHLLVTENGQLLTVNGPPGTGKTTLIQSVVANYYVAAALDEKDAPVIFTVSANNNAVTNVLDSFAAACSPDEKASDPLTRRWLPNLSSFGLFFPSGSQKVDVSKYHIAHLPMYGRPLSGWPTAMLESLGAAEAAYMQAAKVYLREEVMSIAQIKSSLLQRLRELREQLNGVLDASEAVLTYRVAFAPLSQDEASQSFVQREVSANKEAANLRAEVVKAMPELAAAQTKLAEMETASDDALQAFSPAGLLNLFLGVFPQVRAQRWDKTRSILKGAGFRDGLFSSLKLPSSDRLRSALESEVAPLRARVTRLQSSADVRRREAEDSINRQHSELNCRREELGNWASVEAEWLEVVDRLVAVFPEATSNTLDGERLIRDPYQTDRCLDITVRYEMFLVATRYWEARWLHSARELTGDSRALRGFREGKSQHNAETRLRELAQLTPCFISTLFMFPEHLHDFDRSAASGAQNALLTNFIDLLIVDEAGQVPPEIGAPALALANKALIIGDIHQIEPVWSVGAAVDYGTLKSVGLIESEDDLDELGALAHNGSLMKLARRASAFTRDDEQGLFLSEHRRCQTPIIQICNELVYKDRLVPCVPDVANPILPALGWANVRSTSIQAAGSRSNSGEAEAIAEWLSRRRAEIENRYGKKLEQVVGVLTPFGNQKYVLREHLRQYRIGEEMTVGTIHALQGADRDIVVFSPVHTAEDGDAPFFDKGPNLINVAVSRARHSFLVFGDMRMFNPARRSCPSGVLAAHLFQHGIEIRDVLSRPEFVRGANRGHTSRIESLEAHRATLHDALTHAVERVLIVSPYVSQAAIYEDNIPNAISSARGRNVRVLVVFDPQLNRDGGSVRESARLGLSSLRAACRSVRCGAHP